MIDKNKLNTLLENKLTEIGGFLVDTQVGNGNQIKVEVDKPGGIHIDECVAISKFIEEKLDREKEDFSLQVSSPGMDKPFKVKQQYQKNIGKNIEIFLENGEVVKGILKEFDNDTVKVESIKNKENQIHSILFKNIKQTKKVFSFKIN